jgi:hypothetical protein
MNILAPIVLFTYNRPKHTQQTIEALQRNELACDSELFIYCDGPKLNADEAALDNIKKVRELAHNVTGFKKVTVIEQEKNLGLANSIIGGVTEVVNRYGKVIVLEDDILTAIGFLKYMNDALTIYENEPLVMHVSGYIYPSKLDKQNEPATTLFLKIYSCWGWATWKNAWEHYDHNIEGHYRFFNSPKKKKKFNIEGSADNFSQLEDNYKGKIYTWAVRWYASWLRANGISLFPSKSLVNNIGHDGSGIHCNPSNVYNTKQIDYITVEKQRIVENIKYRKAINQFYEEIYYTRWSIQNLKNKTKALIGIIKK